MLVYWRVTKKQVGQLGYQLVIIHVSNNLALGSRQLCFFAIKLEAAIGRGSDSILLLFIR